MAKNKNPEEEPEEIEVTARIRFFGPKRDKVTGQKIIVEVGEDVVLPYRLAMRLAAGNDPKVAVEKEDRAEAKDNAKIKAKAAAAQEKADEKAAKAAG